MRDGKKRVSWAASVVAVAILGLLATLGGVFTFRIT
jgi:hypothetical protein